MPETTMLTWVMHEQRFRCLVATHAHEHTHARTHAYTHSHSLTLNQSHTRTYTRKHHVNLCDASQQRDRGDPTGAGDCGRGEGAGEETEQYVVIFATVFPFFGPFVVSPVLRASGNPRVTCRLAQEMTR